MREVTSLPITTLPDGRITVPVTIMGQQFQVLVDTAGNASTLSESVTTKLKLGLHRTYDFGPRYSDHVPVRIGRVPPFPMTFRAVDDTELPKGADGTLAMDFFHVVDFEIDFRHAALNLFEQDHCPDQVVYWSTGPYTRIDLQSSMVRFRSYIYIWSAKVPRTFSVTLDGKQLLAIIDTNAPTSTMSIDYAHETFGYSDRTFPVTPVNDPDPAQAGEVDTHPFTALSFGGVTVEHPKILLTNDRGVLHLGVNVLRQLHLYVATKDNGYLYVTAAGAH